MSPVGGRSSAGVRTSSDDFAEDVEQNMGGHRVSSVEADIMVGRESVAEAVDMQTRKR